MGVLDDIRRGITAPAPVVMRAALRMLPVSAVFALAAAVLTGVDGAPLIIVTGLLQLVGNFWIAGRRSRS